jgi:hypothetical protein
MAYSQRVEAKRFHMAQKVEVKTISYRTVSPKAEVKRFQCGAGRDVVKRFHMGSTRTVK